MTILGVAQGALASEQPVTLNPATKQTLRGIAYNLATCASMVHFRSDFSDFQAELKDQANLAAGASMAVFKWVNLSKYGDPMDPPAKKFPRAQLTADYGGAGE